MGKVAPMATPLPPPPTRGEVFRRSCDQAVPQTPPGTLPLVGRVGEGVVPWR